jgi:BatD DUF11 like domain
MLMSALFTRVLTIAALWSLVATMSRAQVTASLSPQIISAGTAAELSITYEGPQASIESLPEVRVPGLDVSGPQSQTTFSPSSNGVTTYRRDLTWQLFAAKPGRYVIPPLTIVLGGQSFTTRELALEVREGAAPAVPLDPFLKINLGKKELYLGEVTPIAITVFVHRRTQLRNYDHPKLPRENFVVKRFPPPGPAALVEVNGERYQPIQFSSSLSAIREGELELGPATLECMIDFPVGAEDARSVPQGFAPPSFFQRMATRQFSLKSETVKIKVKPLPTDGRPADFTGAVGHFGLVTRASQPLQQIHVGDPISLDFFITGQGNFDSITAPTPNPPDGWKLYPPKVTQENRSTGLDPGTQVYNQVIVPQKVAQAIPAFQLSYFDPAQGKYLVARSAPIPLTMLLDEPKPDTRTGEAPTKDFSFVQATIPEEKLVDILTVRPVTSPLLSLTAPAVGGALAWALQAIPAAIVIALVGVGLHRRSRERAAAEQLARFGHPRPLAEIRRDMKRSGLSRRAFYSLAREYATAVEFHRDRHGAAAAGDEALDAILARQSYYSYSGEDADAAATVPLPEQKEVLAALEHAGR